METRIFFFSILSGNAEGKFTLDPHHRGSDHCSTADYKMTQLFSLVIEATDGATPLTRMAFVTVQIGG